MFGSIDASHTKYNDQGGASRFFPTFHYYGKCPSAERHAGCEGLLWAVDKNNPFGFRRIGATEHAALKALEAAALAEGKRIQLCAEGNVHPTVKRLSTGEWLCRLVTPTGGSTGDLTAGSWSIPIAAHRAGLQAHGMELAPEAIAIGEARAAHWLREEPQLVLQVVSAPPAPKPAKSHVVQCDLFASVAK